MPEFTWLIEGRKVLSIFETRPEINQNIQQILGIHEKFLTQLQTISPMSSSQATDGASDLAPRGLSKRLGAIDLSGLKGLQNRSLRIRNFKASINQRLKAMQAEPLEALEVARAVENLASYLCRLQAPQILIKKLSSVSVIQCVRRLL